MGKLWPEYGQAEIWIGTESFVINTFGRKSSIFERSASLRRTCGARRVCFLSYLSSFMLRLNNSRDTRRFITSLNEVRGASTVNREELLRLGMDILALGADERVPPSKGNHAQMTRITISVFIDQRINVPDRMMKAPI